MQTRGHQNGFDLARQTAARWPHIAIVVASGQIKPAPGDIPEGATFIGKPFSANLVRKHLRETLPVQKQPAPLKG